MEPTGNVDGVTPALTHSSLAGTYISAFCVDVVLKICTVRTLPFGNRHQLSSLVRPIFVLATVPNLVHASTQVTFNGYQIAVRESERAPNRTRPSSSTVETASPTMKSNPGVGLFIADQVLEIGSKISPLASLSAVVSVSPRTSEYSPPT